MKLEYAGQNENNGLHPKKFGVIFFQPLLLDSKHGDALVAMISCDTFLESLKHTD